MSVSRCASKYSDDQLNAYQVDFSTGDTISGPKTMSRPTIASRAF